MLGIPTRSDVVDVEYQKSVAAEKLRYNDRINRRGSRAVDQFKPEWPLSIEGRNGTEAHRLKEENKRIAKCSDLYLMFDESFVVFEKGSRLTMIPATVLLDQKSPLNYLSFRNRQYTRDKIEDLVDVKGGFVFNGVEYTAKPDSYTVSGSAPKAFVNVLGISVTNDETLPRFTVPDSWAQQEVDWVKKYREGGNEVAYLFLEQYSGWGSFEHKSSKGEELDNVISALNRIDLSKILGMPFNLKD